MGRLKEARERVQRARKELFDKMRLRRELSEQFLDACAEERAAHAELTDALAERAEAASAELDAAAVAMTSGEEGSS